MAGQLLDNRRIIMTNKTKPIIDCTTYQGDGIENNYINDQLILSLEDVDDLALAWIVTKTFDFYSIIEENSTKVREEVTSTHPKWLWRSGGNHGNGSINITQWFHNHYDKLIHRNQFSGYLVIAVYDFEYKSFWLPGGKWSFNAKLILNGKLKWKKHYFSSSNNQYGIKYIKIFSINAINKTIRISESIEEISKNSIADYVTTNCNFSKYDKKLKKLIKTRYKK